LLGEHLFQLPNFCSQLFDQVGLVNETSVIFRGAIFAFGRHASHTASSTGFHAIALIARLVSQAVLIPQLRVLAALLRTYLYFALLAAEAGQRTARFLASRWLGFRGLALGGFVVNHRAVIV
jgi:hypothetical protein